MTVNVGKLKCMFFPLALGMLAAGAEAAQAPAYPSKPIRFLVGFVPGGGTDVTARVVGQKLSERLGQPVIVDNRAGAGGALAREIVRNAAPDGYTLLILTSSQMVNASIVRKDPVDIRVGFDHISLLVWYPYLLVSNPSLPVKSVSELLTYARGKPGHLNYGTPGIGTAAHLSTELLKYMTKTDMLHVPYKGSGAIIRDLLGGQVHIAFTSAISTVPHVNAGRLRAIAVSSATRAKVLPNVPTVAEGGVAGYDSTGWYSIATSPKTPRNIVMRLNKELAGVLDSDDLRKAMLADGAEPSHSSPESLDRKIQEEVNKWAKLIAATGIKLQ